MFDGRKIESAIRKVYSCLYPNKRERKKALARLDMEKLVQSIRYRSETPLAYYTGGSADLSMKYHGPDLFEQKACRIFQEPVRRLGFTADSLRKVTLRYTGRSATP